MVVVVNNFDNVDVFFGEFGVGKGLFKNNVDFVEKGFNYSFEFLMCDYSMNVDIVYQGFNVERCLLVGREYFFEFFGSGVDVVEGFGVGVDVDFVFVVEFFGEVVNDGFVKVVVIKVMIESGIFDGEFVFFEFDDGVGVVGVIDIDKGNVVGFFIRVGEIQFGDIVVESGGGGVVDEVEWFEIGNFGGIDKGVVLDIGELGGNVQDEVGYWEFEFGSSGLFDFVEEYGCELGGREFGFFVEV